MSPVVSIVLPTYNCPHYVGEAVRSMLEQTFGDFELILIDDGSRDETLDVLRTFTDKRTRLFTQENRGLATTLNRGIELARGRYIARQDQDDLSFPERLARQATFLDAHPRCALVGTWAEIWRERERTGRKHMHPADDATLKFELLLNNPFVHSSVMIRKAALEKVGGYCTDRARQPPEDFELWSRIAREYDVANLPEVLHIYREIEGSMSRDGPSPFLDHLVTISAENIAWAAGASRDDAQAVNIAALAHRAEYKLVGRPDFEAMRAMLRKAAERVVPEPLRGRFRTEADRRVDALRLRYWEIQHGRGLRGQLLEMARRVYRKLRSA